ncbi:MAG: hypothetical protein GY861_10860 [bacterium]|nr:hypothetical protein [bacterium]
MSDSRVIELRKVISTKTLALGEEPKAKYKTNLKCDKGNILVLSLPQIVDVLADTLFKQEKLQHAANLIGCKLNEDYSDLIDDLTLRGKILQYKESKKELEKLNIKLDSLRSEELRRTDELDDLEAILKL